MSFGRRERFYRQTELQNFRQTKLMKLVDRYLLVKGCRSFVLICFPLVLSVTLQFNKAF